MTNFIAEINIMTKKEILDPQGKAVKLGLANLGLQEVQEVRIGKHIVLNINAENEEVAHQKIKTACQKLLANLIMEEYEYTLRKN
jgi:phosphoribosylformylglycinamidine synthase